MDDDDIWKFVDKMDEELQGKSQYNKLAVTN